MFRCVFDTNSVVSAALFADSVPARALMLALRLGVVLMSQDLADELADVLARPRFIRYSSLQARKTLLDNLMQQTEWMEVTQQIHACRDPDDDKILELAVNGEADYIVTGDDDLLVMKPFRRIDIVTPAEFLAIASAIDQ
ncbi:MAG: putative toxin-antitoxin system toxin component, PIN family [Chloroflexi bacterium]|nr:putative toxin-antitoxin system toxin component, PIN family [Chloroflexota bacterium]